MYLATNNSAMPLCPVNIHYKTRTMKIKGLVDTGAELTLVSDALLKQLPAKWRKQVMKPDATKFSLQAADGKMLHHME